jgi:hypothetical protein
LRIIDGQLSLEDNVVRVVQLLRDHWKAIASAVVAAPILFAAGHFLWITERTTLVGEVRPNSPPPEYLYLDTERTLAYLGQIEGGLTAREKRVESRSVSTKGSLKAGLIADIAAEQQRQQAIEQQVTPNATDRFFTLLGKLRSGRDEREGDQAPWIVDVNARIEGDEGVVRIVKRLQKLREGDFVRIGNARLLLPPYAAAVPKARYANSYRGADLRQPRRPPPAPATLEARREVAAYLRLLGADPFLPFVVPTWSDGEVSDQVTFFVPARYSALIENERLLAGKLTVVGKVVYLDARRLIDDDCIDPPVASGPCLYSDRQTVASFAPALQRAAGSVLKRFGFRRATVATAVRESVTFEAPLAVVLPVAIYQ